MVVLCTASAEWAAAAESGVVRVIFSPCSSSVECLCAIRLLVSCVRKQASIFLCITAAFRALLLHLCPLFLLIMRALQYSFFLLLSMDVLLLLSATCYALDGGPATTTRIPSRSLVYTPTQAKILRLHSFVIAQYAHNRLNHHINNNKKKPNHFSSLTHKERKQSILR